MPDPFGVRTAALSCGDHIQGDGSQARETGPDVPHVGGESSMWRTGIALADFDAQEYGPEYVSLQLGGAVHIASDVAVDQGYIYGHNTLDEVGWFPAHFVDIV